MWVECGRMVLWCAKDAIRAGTRCIRFRMGNGLNVLPDVEKVAFDGQKALAESALSDSPWRSASRVPCSSSGLLRVRPRREYNNIFPGTFLALLRRIMAWISGSKLPASGGLNVLGARLWNWEHSAWWLPARVANFNRLWRSLASLRGGFVGWESL